MAMEESKLNTVVEIAKYLEESDATKLAQQINRWKDIKVNIGVTGLSGVGKSYFINAMRNLRPLDVGAAKVGTEETTMEPTSYPHPQNENLVFWDLPGVGTKKFPRNEYIDAIGFKKYDFFLILSCTRFYEDDYWLAEEIIRAGKKFYFVRTKLDIDVECARADMGVPESDTMRTIREDCENHLKGIGIKTPNVFLISSRYPNAYDFDSVVSNLIDGASDMQKEVLTLTVFSWSNRKLLDSKRAILQGRITKRAVMASAPLMIPFLGSTIRSKVVEDEADLYRKEFGLDSENLKKVAARIGVPISGLRVKSQPFSGNVLDSTIASIPIPVAVLPLNIAKGAVVAVRGYFGVKSFLQETLDATFRDAVGIHEAYCNQLGSAKL